MPESPDFGERIGKPAIDDQSSWGLNGRSTPAKSKAENQRAFCRKPWQSPAVRSRPPGALRTRTWKYRAGSSLRACLPAFESGRPPDALPSASPGIACNRARSGFASEICPASIGLDAVSKQCNTEYSKIAYSDERPIASTEKPGRNRNKDLPGGATANVPLAEHDFC